TGGARAISIPARAGPGPTTATAANGLPSAAARPDPCFRPSDPVAYFGHALPAATPEVLSSAELKRQPCPLAEAGASRSGACSRVRPRGGRHGNQPIE